MHVCVSNGSLVSLRARPWRQIHESSVITQGADSNYLIPISITKRSSLREEAKWNTIASRACARREQSRPARSLNIVHFYSITARVTMRLPRTRKTQVGATGLWRDNKTLTLWWALISGWCQNGIKAFSGFLLIRHGTCWTRKQSTLLEELAVSDVPQISLGASTLPVNSSHRYWLHFLLRPGRWRTAIILIVVYQSEPQRGSNSLPES